MQNNHVTFIHSYAQTLYQLCRFNSLSLCLFPLLLQAPSAPGSSYLFSPSTALLTRSCTPWPLDPSKRPFCRCGLTTDRGDPCWAVTKLITRRSPGRKCGPCRRTAMASPRGTHWRRHAHKPSSPRWKIPTRDTMTLRLAHSSSNRSSAQPCRCCRRNKRCRTHTLRHTYIQMNSSRCLNTMGFRSIHLCSWECLSWFDVRSWWKGRSRGSLWPDFSSCCGNPLVFISVYPTVCLSCLSNSSHNSRWVKCSAEVTYTAAQLPQWRQHAGSRGNLFPCRTEVLLH